MKFLKTLDLYKAIVLLSLVLLPVGYYFVDSLDASILACKRTLQEAKRPGGTMEQIGGLMKKVEIVAQNKRSTADTIDSPRTYFEGQILLSGAGGLKTTDFSPSPPKEETATVGKQRIADYVVDIEWRKDLTAKLDFVYAVVFNIESGATNNDKASAKESVWKLRELTIENATDDRTLTSYNTPPPELDDKWKFKRMAFARREPKKAN